MYNMEGSYLSLGCLSGIIPVAKPGQRTCTFRDPCIADSPSPTFLFQLIDTLANPAGVTQLAWDDVSEVFPSNFFNSWLQARTSKWKLFCDFTFSFSIN